MIKGRRPERPPASGSAFRLGDDMWDIVQDCWKKRPSARPTMKQVVERLPPSYRSGPTGTVVTSISRRAWSEEIRLRDTYGLQNSPSSSQWDSSTSRRGRQTRLWESLPHLMSLRTEKQGIFSLNGESKMNELQHGAGASGKPTLGDFNLDFWRKLNDMSPNLRPSSTRPSGPVPWSSVIERRRKRNLLPARSTSVLQINDYNSPSPKGLTLRMHILLTKVGFIFPEDYPWLFCNQLFKSLEASASLDPRGRPFESGDPLVYTFIDQ